MWIQDNNKKNSKALDSNVTHMYYITIEHDKNFEHFFY